MPHFLDRYSRLDSPIHRLGAGVKLLVALTIVIFTATIPQRFAPALAVIATGLLAIAAISRIPWMFIIRRMLWLEPLILGVAVLSCFQPGGWHIFLLLVIRSSLCLLAMLLLANTTPFSELLRILRRVRVPALLITTLALMYRYLFVLLDEARRMRRARASRTFLPSRMLWWGSLSTVIAHLFVRTSDRADRIYLAMCARGWR